jgi:dethiobiotin synthetase
MQKLQQSGLRVNAMKPVAAGTEPSVLPAVNGDALLLQQQASQSADYRLVNPYLFESSIAPHIAAMKQGVEIDLEVIRQAYNLLEQQADITLVEGAGGWLVPLNDFADISDIPPLLGLPVILVVGLKLGCINHARLSLQAVKAKGCQLAGWVGSQVDEAMSHVDDNIATLSRYLEVPCLGIIPFLPQSKIAGASGYLLIDQLVKHNE